MKLVNPNQEILMEVATKADYITTYGGCVCYYQHTDMQYKGYPTCQCQCKSGNVANDNMNNFSADKA